MVKSGVKHAMNRYHFDKCKTVNSLFVEQMWIYSVELKENKKINKNDLEMFIEHGWTVGRKMKF